SHGAASTSSVWKRTKAPTEPPGPATDAGESSRPAQSAPTAAQPVRTAQPASRTARRTGLRVTTSSPASANQPAGNTTAPPPSGSTTAAASWSPYGPSGPEVPASGP